MRSLLTLTFIALTNLVAQTPADSTLKNWRPIDTRLNSAIKVHPEFAFLIPPRDSISIPDDTLKETKPVLKLNSYHTSPCNYLEGRYVYLQNGTTVRYICWRGILAATDPNEKTIWERKLSKFSDSFVLGMAYSGDKKYDVLIEMIDGSRYRMKSKTGKVKPVK